MTTIAIKDGLVAVDTQATGGGQVIRVPKMVRLPDGGVAAGCGVFRKVWAGLRWLSEGQQGEAPDIDDAEIVIVAPDGSIHIAEGMFPPYPIMDTSYATGCGADIARVAMAEGDTPVQAVAKSCAHDHMTSAPIMSMQAIVVVFPEAEMHKVRVRRK